MGWVCTAGSGSSLIMSDFGFPREVFLLRGCGVSVRVRGADVALSTEALAGKKQTGSGLTDSARRR